MDTLQAIILGIVQGLSEFLPISSSGHLILTRKLMGLQGRHDLAFDVALHLGTAVAVLLYFQRVWLALAKAFFASVREFDIQSHFDRRLAWLLILGTIPGALLGWLGKEFIEEYLRDDLRVFAGALIFFAVFLYLADVFGRKTRDLEQIGTADATLIGLFQAVALIPGVSRSGITMTTGLFQNFNRRSAAEFSFLLSAPIIVGAALKEGLHLFKTGLSSAEMFLFAVGMVTSAVSGFLCIRFFLRYVQTHTVLPFVIYRMALGILLFVLIFMGKMTT